MILKNSLLFALTLFTAGCATVTNYSPMQHIPRDGAITVLPFKNNTNTPLAGKKAKNIMESILVAKNHSVKIDTASRYGYSDENRPNSFPPIQTRYYLQGSINEWRYKTGLDAEPAVALNFNVVDRSTGTIVYSAVGAKNGWGQESVGSVAQKLMLELTQR